MKRESQHFNVLKYPNCVLTNTQTTVLAIIGAQLMHIFNRNNPLCPPPFTQFYLQGPTNLTFSPNLGSGPSKLLLSVTPGKGLLG